jgi:hypothetical protein
MSEYPTDDQLEKIKEWDYLDFENLALYVQAIWHWGEDYARLGDWKEDEHGTKYRPFELVTSGWSGNEDIVCALNKNQMFNMMCWYSSHRGGLHIYKIKKIT